MNRLTVLVVVVVAALCFSLMAIYTSSRSPSSDPNADHASHRTNEWGVKALRELLGRAGLKTADWSKPFGELGDERGVLWVFDPQAEIGTEEIRGLLAWVARGNRAIIVPDPADSVRGATFPNAGPDRSLLAALGWGAAQSGAPMPERVHVQPTDPFCRDVGQLHLPRAWRLQDGSAQAVEAETQQRLDEAPTLWRVAGKEGSPIIAAGTVGQGELVVLCDADMLANSSIGEADNVVLAANLSFGGPGDQVYFDEGHRARTPAAMGKKLDRSAPDRAIGALILIFAAFFAGRMFRFGGIVPSPLPPRRSAVEYVRAFATVYQRAGRPRAALDMAFTQFQSRLAIAAVVSPTLEPDALARAVARRRPAIDPDELETLLRDCRAALEPGSHLHDADLLRLVRNIARFEQELTPHDL